MIKILSAETRRYRPSSKGAKLHISGRVTDGGSNLEGSVIKFAFTYVAAIQRVFFQQAKPPDFAGEAPHTCYHICQTSAISRGQMRRMQAAAMQLSNSRTAVDRSSRTKTGKTIK